MFLQAVLQPFHHSARGGFVHPGEDDGEFIAADPGGNVLRPKGYPENFGRPQQKPVAFGVAQSVIDLLQSVHVQHQDGQDGIAGARGARQLFLEEPAVVKAGEAVMQAYIPELVLDLFLLGDVQAGPDEPGELPFEVEKGPAAAEHVAVSIVIAPQPEFRLESFSGVDSAFEGPPGPLGVLGVDPLRPAFPQFLLERTPGEPQPGFVEVVEPAVTPRAPDEGREFFEDGDVEIPGFDDDLVGPAALESDGVGGSQAGDGGEV